MSRQDEQIAVGDWEGRALKAERALSNIKQLLESSPGDNLSEVALRNLRAYVDRIA